MTEKLSVCGNKYTFVFDENFSVVSILRYGEPWSDEAPYNLKYGRAISALASELFEARLMIESMRELLPEKPSE